MFVILRFDECDNMVIVGVTDNEDRLKEILDENPTFIYSTADTL